MRQAIPEKGPRLMRSDVEVVILTLCLLRDHMDVAYHASEALSSYNCGNPDLRRFGSDVIDLMKLYDQFWKSIVFRIWEDEAVQLSPLDASCSLTWGTQSIRKYILTVYSHTCGDQSTLWAWVARDLGMS